MLYALLIVSFIAIVEGVIIYWTVFRTSKEEKNAIKEIEKSKVIIQKEEKKIEDAINDISKINDNDYTDVSDAIDLVKQANSKL